MDEYYSIERQFETMESMPVKRDFFNDIDDKATLKKALPLLLKCYRLYQIKWGVHGQRGDDGINNPLAQEEMKTLGDYLEHELIK